MNLECDLNDQVEQAASSVAASLIYELDRAANLINTIDDVSYRRQAKTSSSVGAQFRHNLDVISAFLKGVRIGRIDYSDRERDLRIESHRSSAIAKIQNLKAIVGKITRTSPPERLQVRSESKSDLWFPSSVLRELEFVHSHTVHHHALIAEKLQGLGIRVEKDFGVALSTIQYWNKQAA